MKNLNPQVELSEHFQNTDISFLKNSVPKNIDLKCKCVLANTLKTELRVQKPKPPDNLCFGTGGE